MKMEDGVNAHRGVTPPSSRNNELRDLQACTNDSKGVYFCGKCEGVKDSSKGLTGLIYCSFFFLQNDHFGAYVHWVCQFSAKVDCFPSSQSTDV